MPRLGLLALVLLACPVAALGCNEGEQARGGAGGRPASGGNAAADAGRTPGGNGGSAAGGSGGSAGDGASAGNGAFAGYAASAGYGGMPGAGSGGVLGGFPGYVKETPTRYSEPAQGWSLHTDEQNHAPPILLALDDGVVLAGSTADPKVLGLSEFDEQDPSIVDRAYLERRSADGSRRWALGLGSAGMPQALARAADGIVVAAPYAPGVPDISNGTLSHELYVAKLGLDGALMFETHFALPHELTSVQGVAVDATGAIYIAGYYFDTDGLSIHHGTLIKLDGAGALVWEATFLDSNLGAEALGITALHGGDLIVTGRFSGLLLFGGATSMLTAESDDGNGFIARFDSNGRPLWSARFGGAAAAHGRVLGALPGGDFLLSGFASTAVELGGITAAIRPDRAFAGFVARLNGSGSASWIALADELAPAALATDGGTVASAALDNSVYLRSYDARYGGNLDARRVVGNDAQNRSRSVALGPGALWVSGTFDQEVEFTGDVKLTSDAGGVYLVKLLPE